MLPLILPPKRFESDEDPKFDSIRHKPWFFKLKSIRRRISDLKTATHILKTHRVPVATAAAECCVAAKDLSDYIKFIKGMCRSDELYRRTFQSILDEAYVLYCESNAQLSIHQCIRKIAKLYGANQEHVCELWDIDPTFYPKGYK